MVGIGGCEEAEAERGATNGRHVTIASSPRIVKMASRFLLTARFCVILNLYSDASLNKGGAYLFTGRIWRTNPI